MNLGIEIGRSWQEPHQIENSGMPENAILRTAMWPGSTLFRCLDLKSRDLLFDFAVFALGALIIFFFKVGQSQLKRIALLALFAIKFIQRHGASF